MKFDSDKDRLGVILLGSLFLTPEEFKNLGKQTIYGSAFGENIFPSMERKESNNR